MRAAGPAGCSVIRPSGRRRRTAALGVSLVTVLVVGGVVALSRASLDVPTVNPKAIADTARRGSEDVAIAVARAASLVVERTARFAEREVDASPPPPVETAEPPKPRRKAAPLTEAQSSVKPKRAERAVPETEASKRREEPPTSDEALRALGLKVPYR